VHICSYFPHDENTAHGEAHLTVGVKGMGIKHAIENEGWTILSTDVKRREVKFQCCSNNYTLLEYYLHLQRKPLYYLVSMATHKLLG